MTRALGINHVALEVGDLEGAVDFYCGLFGFDVRGRVPGMAFLDMGDQFLALSEGRDAPPDAERHFGIVVDDREAVREAAIARGLEGGEPGGHLGFRDPWGNSIEVVDYRDVQFTKSAAVLAKLGAGGIQKSPDALRELSERGLLG